MLQVNDWISCNRIDFKVRPVYKILIKISPQVPAEILVLPTGTKCKQSRALFYDLCIHVTQ